MLTSDIGEIEQTFNICTQSLGEKVLTRATTKGDNLLFLHLPSPPLANTRKLQRKAG